MLTTGELYNDPGADYFTRQTPVKTMARAPCASGWGETPALLTFALHGARTDQY